MFLPQLLHALFPFFPSLVLFFFPTAIQAQFRFDNLLEGIGMEAAQKMINGDLGEQNDPLRNVFGIWGRLLNRMAQKNPPSDDELHLKGAQEGDQEEGNVIGEDPEGLNFPPRGGGGFGGGSAKMFCGGSAKQPTGRDTVGKTSLSGPNKIIDEQRLNELLPRLSPNYAKEEKHSPETTTEKMTTTTTTEPKTTTQPMTTTAETTMMANTQLTTAKKTKEDEQKMAKKNKRRKKGRRKNAEEEDNGTKTNTTTMASPTPTPTNTSPIPINNGLINETQKTGQNQHFTTKVGETIHLSTSAEEKRKGQMEIIKETEFAGLNETVLERAENETAQLIAEIENVLADAEMGPNGHWLRQQTGDQNITTTRSWSSTMTTTDNKKEEEITVDSRNKTKTEEKQQQKEERSYEEEGAEREEEEEGESYETEESEEGKEEGEERNGTVQQEKQKKEDNTTMGETAKDEEGMRKSEETERKSKPMEENKQGTAEATTTWASTERPGSTAAKGTQRMNGTKKGIPEAEEEDQHQQQQIAAQLQLDSAVTVSSPFPSPSPTTAQQTPQSAQNIFNLNANSNSYANPNFTNVMKPVNSIIDGIGPLILPLIGYSQRAFDAYAPLVAQRSEGLPIFRPSAMADAPLSPQQQQTHPLLPIGTSFSSGTVQQTKMPLPSQQSPQFPHAMPSSPSSSVKASRPNVAQPPGQTHHSSAGNLETAKEAPSLEMLGRIIEERRKNEQKQRGNGNERKEISGSSPPEAELPYFPPNLPSNGPAHPFEQPVPERPVEKKTDQGYDAGRQTVHDTFHEDSGLMLGTQHTQSDQQTNGPMALPPAEVAFGNGKRPNGSFGFTRR
ncbi:hypothetical protein niasHS_007411 [Heterodera schachtii]|uniref:Uncharacterized protein n=1 Tax=Heterodera schachtii TaxID=97005 RepID=A0ABD2JXE5_HETSC